MRILGKAKPLLGVAVLACGALLALCPQALAEFQGTPGKIAYIDGTSTQFPLKIWDPVRATPLNPDNGIETRVASTFHHAAGGNEIILGQPSPPVFSPDGTKIAFSRLVTDPGYPHEFVGYHTAIFVMNVNGTEEHQITFPPEALVPPEDCDEDCPGHAVADSMPAWSPDGRTIAFIREVGASEADELYGERIENIWEASAAGGGETQITHGKEDKLYESVVWGKKGMVSVYAEGEEGRVFKLAVMHGGSPTPIASPPYVADYDVSPDGETVSYSAVTPSGLQLHTVSIDGGDDTDLGTPPINLDRFSNTGNGLLQVDCRPQTGPNNVEFTQCGIFERHLEDPDGDIRPDEPPDRIILPWIDFGGVGGGVTREWWDVQAQQLPVVFVPGFLGSEIKGCGTTQWFSYTPDLEGMALGPDGQSNDRCQDSAADGEVVKFYKSTAQWIKQGFGASNTLFECERANVLGWDWRKAPQPNLEALNEKITEALAADNCAEKEGATRVVIMAHSYGGLLTRAYLNEPEDARRVARVLTVGTPYWGSPKSIFPPAFGIEMPYNKDNLIFNEAALKTFSDNLAGLMQLFPSKEYGPWLTVNGKTMGALEVQPFLTSIGVSSSLFGQAQANHENIFDHFFTNYGLIDYRQVVGTGLATVGTVTIDGEVGSTAKIHMTWVNGDGTVPATSATTGEIGSQPPGSVHIQDVCGIEHMEETESGQVQSPYFEFLDHGAIPRKTVGACPFSAGLLDIANSSGTLGPPSSSRVRRAEERGAVDSAASASVPMSLEEAYLANLIELYRLPSGEQALLDSTKPVTLGGNADNLTFTITELSEQGEGVTRRYGPLSGAVEINSASGGQAVTLNGQPVEGTVIRDPAHEREEHEQAESGSQGQSSNTGGANTGGAGSGGAGKEGPVQGGRPSGKLKVGVRAGPRGRILLSARVPARGRLKALAVLPAKATRSSKGRRARRRPVVYGIAGAMARSSGSLTLTIKPSAAGKSALLKAKKLKVTLKITFKPAGAGPSKITRKVAVSS